MKEMMEAMKKMSKGGKKMNPLDKEAKLNVLKDLRDQASKAMMVKITSDSKEGLKKGLDMAKEKLEGMSEEGCPECEGEGCEACSDSEEESEMEEMPEMGDFEDKIEDFSEVDPDELDAQIDKLLKIKEKLKTATMKL